jgi:hypothetical protein
VTRESPLAILVNCLPFKWALSSVPPHVLSKRFTAREAISAPLHLALILHVLSTFIVSHDCGCAGVGARGSLPLVFIAFGYVLGTQFRLMYNKARYQFMFNIIKKGLDLLSL